MAVFSGPEIVSNGLAFHIDAANSLSYPGTGTNWLDLSGNNRHATIVPRVTGYTFNGNFFTFPAGVSPSQHAYVTSPIPTGALSWTVECIVRVPVIPGERHIFRTTGNFGCDLTPTNRLRFYMTNFDVEQSLTPTNSFFPNEWFFLTMTYNRDAQIQAVYKNGVLVGSRSHTVQYNISTGTNQWFARSDLFQDGLGGDAAMVKFYTRALSLLEIRQNFEAVRGRYGI